MRCWVSSDRIGARTCSSVAPCTLLPVLGQRPGSSETGWPSTRFPVGSRGRQLDVTSFGLIAKQHVGGSFRRSSLAEPRRAPPFNVTLPNPPAGFCSAFASTCSRVIDTDPTVATTSDGLGCFACRADVPQAAATKTLIASVKRAAGRCRSRPLVYQRS